jgi:uncharacterized membrane protein
MANMTIAAGQLIINNWWVIPIYFLVLLLAVGTIGYLIARRSRRR